MLDTIKNLTQELYVTKCARELLAKQNEVLFAALKTITIECKLENVSFPSSFNEKIKSYNIQIARQECTISATWRA